MASISWPATLPDCPLLGFTESRIDPFVDDPATVGAPRRRTVFTRSLRRFSVTYPKLTRTQVEALETFWITTLNNGASEFNWNHPRYPTGGGPTELEVRFVTYPTITQVASALYSAQVELQEI